MAGIRRTQERVRRLSADELGVGGAAAIEAHTSNRPDDAAGVDSATVTTVNQLLQAYGGVIFSGPPGTGKTYTAHAVARELAGQEDRVVYVQFHPSFQYEDFMEGFVPKADGSGFELRPKYFRSLCDAAQGDPDNTYVLVIDELSRGEPGRIFGEALTYIERSKRGLSVELASGTKLVVPDNLAVLATMNPNDRGVDEIDAAFGRRFATIAMDPDRDALERRLDANGVPNATARRVVGFFDRANKLAEHNPLGAIGHTYFWDAVDVWSLKRIWEHQLRFVLEKAYRLNRDSYEELLQAYFRIIEAPEDELDSAET